LGGARIRVPSVGKPGHTPGNVKLLLPPRQSRGNSQCIRTFERTGQAVLARIGRNLLRGMLRSLDAAREDVEHLKKLATGSLPAALVEHDVQ
jgi:hypothetical protein